MNVTHKTRKTKWGRLKRRHLHIRRKLSGTAERPRLMVRKTARHIYIMVIDDTPANGSKTLFSLDTNSKENSSKNFANIACAKALGLRAGQALKEKGYTDVVFDRGGYRYHGCIKALCDAVREAGITV